MQYFKLLSIVLAILVLGCKSESKEKKNTEESHLEHQTNQTNDDGTIKVVSLSPHTETMAMIGDAHIHIDYSSPRVRNRLIFGGLLTYDNLWQAGAHKATFIDTNKDLLIAEKIIPAGKYGFFVIPSEGEWTLILNKIWDQHGKDEYDEKEDVLRFKVTPVISEEIQENLEYKITKQTENSGSISLSWEKITISFPFEIK